MAARREPPRTGHAVGLTETLLEHLPMGVLAADSTGRVFTCNAALLSHLDWIGKAPTSCDQLPAALATALHAALGQGCVVRDRDVEIGRSGRGRRSLRIRTAPCRDAAGTGTGALLITEDVTGARQSAERARHGDRLASMGTLAAGMAHEIKNPLQTLKTFAQLMPERYDDPEFRESFSNLIGQEVQRIENLVGQLLRFARPARPQFVPLAVNDIVGHTLRLLRQQIHQREVTLETDLHAARDTVRGDADLLQQALVNLVLNALEAMDRGGRLKVSTDLQKRTHQPRGMFLRVTVRDSGPGILAADLPHVFDPFFTTKPDGTGLGLSVTCGIASEHGGRLEVESEPGHGAAFHLLLPLARRVA